jgi:SpoVK/Ycf46/Vps4 family AAA+-type ATPase
MTSPDRGHPVLPKGIADVRDLPDEDFTRLWDEIVVADGMKDQLLGHAILNFTLRPRVSRAALPMHGILLLVGPPGTGKTSLARGLASRTAESVKSVGQFRYVEVDPHALASAALGKSQRAVTDLFRSTIGEYAAQSPTIVLLDEVETILADRGQLSLAANPIDVHRATDAALVQLDRLADDHNQLLFLATSNFQQSIDSAFLSRADLVVTMPLPDEEARLGILRRTLGAVGEGFEPVAKLVEDPGLRAVARASAGLDGRMVRKLIAAGCALDKDAAIDPARLTLELLLTAAHAARGETERIKEAR